MSFAEEFGHDIPPDDEFIYGGGSYSYRTRKSSKSDGPDTVMGKKYTEIVHETDKAFLFKFERGNAWVAKSKISSLDMEIKKVYIPGWLYINLKYIKEE